MFILAVALLVTRLAGCAATGSPVVVVTPPLTTTNELDGCFVVEQWTQTRSNAWLVNGETISTQWADSFHPSEERTEAIVWTTNKALVFDSTKTIWINHFGTDQTQWQNTDTNLGLVGWSQIEVRL